VRAVEERIGYSIGACRVERELALRLRSCLVRE
jgi:predicted N-formylglutamate amidohydrolase